MKKIIWKAVIGVCVATLIWVFISFIDVVTKNNEPNPEYGRYNVFEMISDYNEEAK